MFLMPKRAERKWLQLRIPSTVSYKLRTWQTFSHTIKPSFIKKYFNLLCFLCSVRRSRSTLKVQKLIQTVFHSTRPMFCPFLVSGTLIIGCGSLRYRLRRLFRHDVLMKIIPFNHQACDLVCDASGAQTEKNEETTMREWDNSGNTFSQ